MKISEITVSDVAKYLRLETGDYDEAQLRAVMMAARLYMESCTGIPAVSDIEGAETLDSHEDFWIAYMVLCQDMYDNRTMYPETRYAASANRVVDSVLGLHRRNLL